MKCKSGIIIGSYIRMKHQAAVGQVVRINRQKALVSIGALFFHLPIQELEVAPHPPSPFIPKKVTKPINFVIPSLSTQTDPILDLHGFNSAQALFALDHFLDRALLLGHSPLKIIHGKGKGILRSVVRSYLHQHPLVKSVIMQSPIRCMAGITVVEL